MHARPVVAVAAALLMGCTAAQPEAAENTDADVAALDARRDEIEQLAVGGDPEAFLGLWTADPYVREPGTALEGAQFAAYLRDFFASGRILSLEIRADRVHVHGNAAYEFGQYDERAVAGTDTLTIANHYAMRWERGDDGAWRIDHLVAGPRAAP